MIIDRNETEVACLFFAFLGYMSDGFDDHCVVVVIVVLWSHDPHGFDGDVEMYSPLQNTSQQRNLT